MILAVVKDVVESGNISLTGVGCVAGKAVFFLCVASYLGRIIASRLGRVLSIINPGIGMKFTLAISLCLVFAYIAELWITR